MVESISSNLYLRSRSSSIVAPVIAPMTPTQPSAGGYEAKLNRAGWQCTNVLLIRHCESLNNENTDLAMAKLGEQASSQALEAELARLHNSDPGISRRGQKQGVSLSEFLEQNGYIGGCLGIEPHLISKKVRVVSSPMYRCLLTAQIVKEGLERAMSRILTENHPPLQEITPNCRVNVNVIPQLHESDGCYETLPDGSTRGVRGMTGTQIENEFNFCCPEEMSEGWYHQEKKETPSEFLTRMEKVESWLWEEHTKCTEICDEDETGSLVVVTHGNLISALLNRLMGGRSGGARGLGSMFMSHNSGVTHVQLWSAPDGRRRLAVLQSSNRTDHLSANPELLTGTRPFDDSWVSEFLCDAEPL